MNAVTKIENTALAPLSESELMGVLKSSLYPGAKDESIKMVLGYCRAAGLDPMQKPVHIVPMDVKEKRDNGGEAFVKRDVVMPGIGLYRTQAARTGTYAGVSEPEFGPTQKIATKIKRYNNAHSNDKTFTWVEDGEIEFPEWCRVTVRRLIGGHVAEFTATEYWTENYATAGKETTSPNAMWKKRPRGQIAKCAEAQALRKAFPEVGSQPTADEMEGKTLGDEDFHGATIDGKTGTVEMPRAKPRTEETPATTAHTESEAPPATIPAATQADVPAGATAPATTENATPPASKPMLEQQKKILRAKLNNTGKTEADIEKQFGKGLDALLFSDFNDVSKWISGH